MNSRPALLVSNLLPSVKSRLRDAARWVRYLPDRTLHPLRRRRAKKALEDLAPAARYFVFLCYGNICRSPFAAERFRQAAVPPETETPRVSSAGFYPVGGRRAPGEAVKAARARGVDLLEHRSRVVGELSALRDGSAASSTVFIAMDAGQRDRLARTFGVPRSRVFVLGDFDPEPVRRRAIHDPFGDPLEVFERVYDRIERCVEAVVKVC